VEKTTIERERRRRSKPQRWTRVHSSTLAVDSSCVFGGFISRRPIVSSDGSNVSVAAYLFQRRVHATKVFYFTQKNKKKRGNAIQKSQVYMHIYRSVL
jgi:hypothetical protein